MPAVIRPDACPGCRQPFRLGYAQRRHARMPARARLLLGAGIAATAVLLPAFFFLLAEGVIGLTAGLRARERGLVFFLAYLPSVPIGLLPAWLGWRYAFS